MRSQNIHFPSWAGLFKLMVSLVNKTLKYQMYETLTHFLPKKNVRSFCSAKASHNFSAKNITTIDIVGTVRLKQILY